jgi:hypothetical protein
MADAKKAIRQDVLEETAEEFLGGKELGLEPVAVAAVAIVVTDLTVLAIEDAVVADRHAMRVTGFKKKEFSRATGEQPRHLVRLPPW